MVQPKSALVNLRASSLVSSDLTGTWHFRALWAEIAEQEKVLAFIREEGSKQYLEKVLKVIQTFDLETFWRAAVQHWQSLKCSFSHGTGAARATAAWEGGVSQERKQNPTNSPPSLKTQTHPDKLCL